MEFRILGPLEVFDEGRSVDVGAAKQRALLAVLLLNANRVVSSDRLTEALWGERAPGTAQKALQVYVSHLRKALGRDRILTRAPGYELRVEAGELDLERFQSLVEGERLVEALRLSRGTPLADFAYEPFAQNEIARLQELVLACLEQRIEGDLAAGRHASLVAELEALVQEHPLRERLRAQLMLALYRSGRQAEALAAFQAGRTILSDELGLEPGAELKELQRRVLAQDPELDLPGPSSARTNEPTPAAQSAPDLGRRRQGRKTVTVLSCDLSASGTELDPESLRHMTGRGFDELLPVLEGHGATVERSMGGAVLAIFGIPVVHEDDALRAARAAVEMRHRLAASRDQLVAQWDSSLELRVGIGTGEVLVDVDTDRPYATGQAVQSAMSLQQAAAPDEVLVDEHTYRLIRYAADVEATDDRARLIGVRPVEFDTDRRFDSPMVGRERERRRLHDAFEQALVDRSCQLFTIIGAPGVGKSRLVREFVQDVSDQALVTRGRCLPYGEGITYWPVLEAVRDAAGIDDAASTDENLSKLAALLHDGEDWELVAQRLGEVVGLSDHVSRPEETFWAVRTFVETLARRRPLVVVFDDIHWGEPTFLDLVDHVADWTADAPVLLICIARPELLDLRGQWGGGKANATSVRLEPLSDEESATLLDNLAGSDLGDAARRRIVETAGGNPLFVEEMLALLDEDRDRSTVEVPATIHALLAARLDGLPDLERAAIEAAAVEGQVFHEASVTHLTGMEATVVHEALLALARRDLVRNDKPVFSGERAFRFRHLLIRDAAYESIPKETRIALHERHAAWLERKAGERTVEFEEIFGYHLERAFRYQVELGAVDDQTRDLGRRAAERLGAAGRRAFARSDAPAGLNLVSRAVALLAPDDPVRVDLVPNVRVVQGMQDLSWAEKVLTEAVEASATSGDRRLAAHALVQRGLLRLFTASETTAQEHIQTAEQAIDVFEELEDQLGLTRAWRLVAQAHYLGRHAGPSVEAAERALSYARATGDRFEEREIVEWLGIALVLGPTPAPEAEATCERLLEYVVGQPELEVHVVGTLAYLAGIQGRPTRFAELIARADRMVDALNEWIWLVPVHFAWVALARTDPTAAEEALRPDFEKLKRIGEKSHFCSYASVLAQAVYSRGRYEDARQLAEEAAQAAGPNDVHTQIIWRGVKAKVLAREGAHESAEELGREGVAIAETSDFLHSHADALMDLAEVLALAGRRTEAAAVLPHALALLEHKGNVLAASQVTAMLEELTQEDLGPPGRAACSGRAGA